MHELYELKEMLCKELEQYGKKGELSAGTLDIVDKLTHTIKNLDKIIENYDEEYSGEYSGEYSREYSNRRGRSNRSYARGRYSREYSRNTDMVDRLRELMSEAPDERSRQEISRLANKMEQM